MKPTDRLAPETQATSDHLLTVLRYVEKNPLRASLVQNAEDWKYGSLWRRVHGEADDLGVLADWPSARPRQWRSQVNKPETESEVEAIHHCVKKGSPYGSESWIFQSAARLSLEHTLRSRGRQEIQKE